MFSLGSVFQDELVEGFGVFGRVVEAWLGGSGSGAGGGAEEDPLFPDPTRERGYGVAYVVFQLPAALDEVMSLEPLDLPPLVLGAGGRGVLKWVGAYNESLLPRPALERSVKAFMDSFEREEVVRKEAERMGEGPDEEGWVRVTRR
jgi:alkanesulfonate monooxygenase SsuD/methylene tetrahydromethanopterin reductase-like flavin-dependent oxidoreductase (luciferase family)